MGKCPVCKNNIADDSAKCEVCGFDELHKEFISKEDGNLWLETVVIPYREKWNDCTEVVRNGADEIILCPVCKTECSNNSYCGTCGFNEVNKKFGSDEEKNFWIESVVIPYLKEWKKDIYEKNIFANRKNINNNSKKTFKIFCPVCKNEVSEQAENCSVCGFSELHKDFINKEEGDLWLENVVYEYREKWEIKDFKIDGTILKKYLGKRAVVAIPRHITVIDEEAFSKCEYLKKVIISSNVSVIGVRAFSQCSNLQKVVFTNNLKSIGLQAFMNCNLNSVVLQEGVEMIDSGAFAKCFNLKKVVFPQTVTIIGKGLFWGCMNMRELTVPHGLDISETCIPAQCTIIRI